LLVNVNKSIELRKTGYVPGRIESHFNRRFAIGSARSVSEIDSLSG